MSNGSAQALADQAYVRTAMAGISDVQLLTLLVSEAPTIGPLWGLPAKDVGWLGLIVPAYPTSVRAVFGLTVNPEVWAEETASMPRLPAEADYPVGSPEGLIGRIIADAYGADTLTESIYDQYKRVLFLAWQHTQALQNATRTPAERREDRRIAQRAIDRARRRNPGLEGWIVNSATGWQGQPERKSSGGLGVAVAAVVVVGLLVGGLR